jgi:hypothetical protein
MDAFYAGLAVGFGILLFHESKILSKKNIIGARYPTASLPNTPVGPIADDCGCCGGGSVAPTTTEIVKITPGVSLMSPKAPGYAAPSNTNSGRGYFYANAAPAPGPQVIIGSPITGVGNNPNLSSPTLSQGTGTGFSTFGSGLFN